MPLFWEESYKSLSFPCGNPQGHNCQKKIPTSIITKAQFMPPLMSSLEPLYFPVNCKRVHCRVYHYCFYHILSLFQFLQCLQCLMTCNEIPFKSSHWYAQKYIWGKQSITSLYYLQKKYSEQLRGTLIFIQSELGLNITNMVLSWLNAYPRT